MSTPIPVEEMSFEEAFAELEAIVQQLEDGSTALADALTLYERGMALAARCQALLDEAEVRIKQLIPNGDGGYDEVEFSGSLDSRE